MVDKFSICIHEPKTRYCHKFCLLSDISDEYAKRLAQLVGMSYSEVTTYLQQMRNEDVAHFTKSLAQWIKDEGIENHCYWDED